MNTIKAITNKDKNLTRLLIVFLAILLVCGLTRGSQFFRVGTFQTMGLLLPEFGLLSVGMALALFTGGIDLSVVYQANMCAIIIAKIITATIAPEATMAEALPMILLSCLAAIAVGVVCGAINGLLISGVGIPPILATLGTQSLILGFAVVITGGSTLSGLPPQMSELLNLRPAGIPLTFILFLVIAVIVGFMLTRTKLGYQLRMYGTNPRATTYSGLSNLKLVVTNYIIIGVLAAFAGIIMIGRLNSAKADNGASYTMQAILIAVLGGMDPKGGKGNIQGVVVAIVIVQMISTWLSMFDISTFYRQIIWGALLLFVLIFNHVINEMNRKKAMKG